MKREEIPALTGLRFFAAFAIVLDHLWPVVMKLNPGVPFADPFHQLSFLGMSLFFLLSGFIIHYNYSGLVGSARGLYDFGVARFSRLYPLFFVVIAYDLICGNFFLYETPELRRPYIEALPYMLTATQSWFYGFIGNHPIAFPYHYAHVAWSISTEFFLYLTYPALCFLALRIRAPRRAIWITLSVSVFATVAFWWLKSHTATIDHLGARIGVVENPNANPGTLFSDWFKYIAPYPRVLEFATGVALAQLHAVLRRPAGLLEQRIATGFFALAVVYIAGFVLRNVIFPPNLSVVFGAVGLLPPIAVLIFCCARYDISFTRFLSGSSVVALGEASYSMYLLHLIVIGKSAPTVFVDATPENIAILIGRVVIILFAVAVLSLGAYRYFEVPARRCLRKFLTVGLSIQFGRRRLA
jgi:peptidoglycan/LPS O-acetylase OafA/YrhL